MTVSFKHYVLLSVPWLSRLRTSPSGMLLESPLFNWPLTMSVFNFGIHNRSMSFVIVILSKPSLLDEGCPSWSPVRCCNDADWVCSAQMHQMCQPVLDVLGDLTYCQLSISMEIETSLRVTLDLCYSHLSTSGISEGFRSLISATSALPKPLEFQHFRQ